VDRLGSYGDALQSAAKRAHLGSDFRVAYTEREDTLFERMLARLGLSEAQALTVQVKLGLLPADLTLDALPAGAAAGVAKDLGWLSQVASRRQPFAAVTHCLCDIP
jgi:protease-4